MTIQEMYENSKKVKHDICEHMETLNKYSTGKTIVELGTRTGNSTLGFLSGKPLWMKSYDIKVLPQAQEIEEQAKTEGINFELYQANDLEIEIPECEILFIDTDHVAKQLEKELFMHHHKAKQYIILHDTVSFIFFPEGNGQINRGMGFAIVHFLDKHPEWFIKEHYLNNHGLMILEKKK